MKEMYFTITGTCYRHGTEFMERDMEVTLEKEPNNEYDKEAIKVTMPGLAQIGYVANSTKTVIGESYSAGRLYDKIGDTAKGKILYIFSNAAVCVVTESGMEKQVTKWSRLFCALFQKRLCVLAQN